MGKSANPPNRSLQRSGGGGGGQDRDSRKTLVVWASPAKLEQTGGRDQVDQGHRRYG